MFDLKRSLSCQFSAVGNGQSPDADHNSKLESTFVSWLKCFDVRCCLADGLVVYSFSVLELGYAREGEKERMSASS